MHDDDQRYRSALDHLLEGFQIVGRDWTYIYLNPAAAAQGRSTPSELVGRKMWEAFPGIDQTPLFAAMQRCMDERVPVSLENLFTYPDQSTRWFELRIEPVPEGLCVCSLDIEDRKLAEAALRRLNEELEARIAHRTRELQTAYEELEAFSYSVSHDLRSPLRSIDGFSQALVEDCATLLDEAGHSHLTRIRAAAQRMGRLIDDMLMLSRVSRTALQRREVDVSALARTIADELAQREPARRVTWKIAPDLRADCDSALARIVLDNLLGNAWKFTSKTGDATIELRASEAEPGAFIVADNGAGFDMAYAGKLFAPFQRLHHERDFQGTGIGLAIVQRVIHKHGGTVRAFGIVGEGATITFGFGTRP